MYLLLLRTSLSSCCSSCCSSCRSSSCFSSSTTCTCLLDDLRVDAGLAATFFFLVGGFLACVELVQIISFKCKRKAQKTLALVACFPFSGLAFFRLGLRLLFNFLPAGFHSSSSWLLAALETSSTSSTNSKLLRIGSSWMFSTSSG